MVKAPKIWRQLLIIHLGLFFSLTASVPMVMADVAAGRSILFNNGNPTYDGLIQANGLFKEATGDPDPLKAAQARFFYAFTHLAVSVLQKGPEADEMDSLKELLEAFGMLRSPYNSISDGPPVTDPPRLNHKLNLPEDSPGGQAVQTFLAVPFLHTLEESLANLNGITNNHLFGIQLTAAEMGDRDIEIDYGDVLVYKSFLYNLKSMILLFNAYNLDGDIRETIALDNARVLQIQRDLLDKYPDLLKLQTETGVSSLANSKAALLSGIESYREALDFITSETDYQEDDLFYFGTEGELNVALALLTNLIEVRNSLSENRPAVLGDGTDEEWELTETVSGDKLWLNISKDTNGALKGGRFWGSFLSTGWNGEVIEWDLNDDTLSFKTSSREWDWYEGWCQTDAAFSAVISGTDNNLLNGTYSVISRTCPGPPPLTDEPFTGVRTFRESHIFKVDINNLYGNTGKNPLNIRQVLPRYDQFNDIMVGTFPPENDSYPVLNGLFPDWLANADLKAELDLQPPPPEGASISGKITIPDYTAGQVFVYATDGPQWSSSHVMGTAVADAQGNYTIDGLPVGSEVYLFAHWDSDGNGISNLGDSLGQKEGPVTIAAVGNGNLDFTVTSNTSWGNKPAIDPTSWLAYVQSTPAATVLNFSVKIIDYDGIPFTPPWNPLAATSHIVEVTFPNNGDTYRLNYSGSAGPSAAWYSLSLTPPGGPRTWGGDYTFTVTDRDGNTGVLVDTLNADPLPLPNPDSFGFIPDGTTPTLTWSTVPGAMRYRLRIFNNYGNIITVLETDNVTSYKIPPGILTLNTDYRLNIDAIREHNPLEVDNITTDPDGFNQAMPFRTGELSSKPYLNISPLGVTTHNDEQYGPKLLFYLIAYDAQGVPGDIKSVKVSWLEGPTLREEKIYHEPYYSPKTPLTFGAYQGISFLPILNGTYTFTIEDREGNTSIQQESLDASPVGHVSRASLRPVNGTVLTGTGVHFDWEDVPEAAFYRLEIYDKSFNRIYLFPTEKSEYDLPGGILEKGKLYRYRISTYGEFFDENADNFSTTPTLLAPTFMTGGAAGTDRPEIDPDNRGVTVFHGKQPGLGADIYSLEFWVKVTDDDGVPENIKGVEVVYPDGQRNRNLVFIPSGNASKAGYYYWSEIYDDSSHIQSGRYTFVVTDLDGHSAQVSDEITVSPIPSVTGITPGQDSTTDLSPLFTFNPVEGASMYVGRVYDTSLTMPKTLFYTDYSTDGRLLVPSGKLQLHTTYSFRVYAFKENEPDTDWDNVSVHPWYPSEYIHFTPDVAMTDTDLDILPDNWETYYFGDLTQGPDDDPDGDGSTNLEEFQNGTEPNIRQYRLSVARTGTGKGTVTSSEPGGIDCGPDCAEWFEPGAEVTLTAISDEGSIFEGWSGGDCSNAGLCTITIAGDNSITANFQLKNVFERWHWRNPLPQGHTLNAVTYGNNFFVAVGDGGTIVTSGDGINWTIRSSGTSNLLKGITYGNNTFVAVGDGGTVLTSGDGINWTIRSSGITNSLNGVTYGNNTFVAVGGEDTIITSVDGTTWMRRFFGYNSSLNGVTFGSGVFVAVGESGTILTSDNGLSWTKRFPGNYERLSGVTYGNNTFVAVGNGGTILTSGDGINWATRGSGTTNFFNGVTYGNNAFVTVGGDNWWSPGSAILTSSDGISWTNSSSGDTNYLIGVTHGNDTFVAVGLKGTILTSDDGITWITRILGTTDTLNGVTYGNNTFVVVGSGGTILTSSDGLTWMSNYSGTSDAINGITYGNNTFVAVGGDRWTLRNAILTSSDGISWTNSSSETYALNGVTYGNNIFVAVDSGGAILTSGDGITWIRSLNQNYASLNEVTYGSGTFVAVGDFGTILTSGDGLTWTRSSSGTYNSLYGVTYGNGTFVAVGNGGTILTSSDGLTWTSNYSGTSDALNGITYVNDTFVVVGGDGWSLRGTILTSDDGIRWRNSSSGALYHLNGVSYGNNTFVAVGQNGTIIQSDWLQPKIFVLPAAYDFGGINVYKTSATPTFTIDNIGAPDLVITSITLEGRDAAEFSQTNNCTAVPPGDSCLLSATFRPTSTGPKTAALVIASNDPDTPIYHLPLSGAGTGIVLKGDINLDGSVDLQDAVLALQVLAGSQLPAMLPGYASSGADVDGDNQIGFADALFVLQKVANMR